MYASFLELNINKNRTGRYVSFKKAKALLHVDELLSLSSKSENLPKLWKCLI